MNEEQKISIEFFIVENGDCAFMTVPVACGLEYVDSLRLNGRTMMAIQNNSILSINFPEISDVTYKALGAMHSKGLKLLVGEFLAHGLHNSYFLDIVVDNN